MVSKCANSECGAPFRYLREGKVFKFEVGRNVAVESSGPRLVTMKKSSTKIEHFWLCGRCSRQMTLHYEGNTGVVVIPLKPRARNAVAS
jgi:hypothetical protein